jgi:putative oxidoreductase
MKKLLMTGDDWTGLILRWSLALIMLPHSIQHTTGGLGGYGYSGMMGYFTQTLHIPAPLAFLVILVEAIAPLSLVLGLGGRFLAVLLIMLMAGTIITVHGQFGFFMNWLGSQKGEGYEYHLLYIALAVALLVNGSGKYSIDRRLAPGMIV